MVSNGGAKAHIGNGSSGEQDRCVVEEVALVVPETDDPTLPVMTFRAWFLGLTSCTVLIFLNTFFTYRTQPLTISSILMQIAVLPIGRFLATVLPKKEVKLCGNWGFNLNPGPFNIKEHVIITIFANCGVSYGGGDAYSIGAITVMKTYYKQSLSFLCALLIVLTTQVLSVV
jgi:OPT family oligopeptide transporter